MQNKEGLIKYLIENYKPGKADWKTTGNLFGFEGEHARKIWLNYRQKNNVEVVNQETVPQQENPLVDFLNTYQSDWKRVSQANKLINHLKFKEETMLVLNLPDLHLDKRDLTGSTIDDNINNYFKVLEYLLAKAYHASKMEKIVFVVGNDLFNTDNVLDSTANGTIQRVNSSWDVAYEKVFDAMVQSIALCSQFANNVHVVLVQGNHDKSKSFYLAHALQQYFKADTSITFDRSSNINKAVVWGNSFVGLNHGNNVNDKLPLAFAQEFYKEWGQCKYHDIYIGDKHHNNEKLFNKKQMQDERQGVRLRILPSLSKPDSWHDDNLYRARQSGIALLYDKERGKFAEYEYQV